ncbi:glycoside hydrolase family 5 protein [Favolaschia claudopus]|uniref:Glycoside hydrolase family 5 protein n=1 Tax=Favolaschia claudopus TaxID=2862362 RepID=A0AAW0C1Z0_9AGAR
MAHIAYPSTPNFRNFNTDYVRALDWKRDSTSTNVDTSSVVAASPSQLPPTRATFIGLVKLHGTNATVVFRNGNKHDAQIQARSWIIEDTKKDNCGTYALLSRAPLSSLVEQILAVRGAGDHFEEIYICGEVAGKGVQKGVAITLMERFFAIFNIRIDGSWVDMRRYKNCYLPEHRIYNLAQYKTFEVDIDFRAPTTAVHDLMNQYTAEVYELCPFGAAFTDDTGNPVSGRGEGIVWTMVRTPYMDESDDRQFDDTVLVNFKTKGEKFAAVAHAPKETKNVDPAAASAAEAFADYALAERRYEQGVEYLESEQAREGQPINGYDYKLTGAFIKWVTNDAIKEERNEMERLGVPERDARRVIGSCDRGVAQLLGMDVHAVYRILRKVSDYALETYYSEVYLEGLQNVPKDAALIVTPCHHNELIDVATLAATIPHRRKVFCWAKSTTFKVPVLGWILASSGAIPVRRNPDKADAGTSNAALFAATTAALARNQVIGVFPEGTSYTEPAIAQIMSGAGWATLEFMRSQHENNKAGSVLIVPVGIVYTNKSKFRSRLRVQYGSPIDAASYISPSLFENADAEAERAVVKIIMKEVETQLVNMTINAPDWETLYAARMARDILWTDERNVKLKDWVVVNQTLIKLFSPSEDPELTTTKRALTKYLSLLQHTRITHAQLRDLKPHSKPSGSTFVFRFIALALRTLLNPSFLLFIPPFIAHIPAYLFAWLGSRLAPPGEEESPAQFKVILGGFGAGLGAGISSFVITALARRLDTPLLKLALKLAGIRRFFLWVFTAWFLMKWHWALVDGNYKRFRLLLAAFKILGSELQPKSWALAPRELGPYETPPPPAANPFLKKNVGSNALGPKAWLKAQPPPVPARRMISHLLLAREAALMSLRRSLGNAETADRRALVDLGGEVFM